MKKNKNGTFSIILRHGSWSDYTLEGNLVLCTDFTKQFVPVGSRVLLAPAKITVSKTERKGFVPVTFSKRSDAFYVNDRGFPVKTYVYKTARWSLIAAGLLPGLGDFAQSFALQNERVILWVNVSKSR